jgi:1-acyl-sn-glycerol-3-phosphate acyltransferase
MNSFHIKPRPVQLLVGDPIPTTGLTTRDTEKLAERARGVIADLYYSHSSLPDLRNQHLPKQEPVK